MSASPIRAIETEYAGCRFRSRLEARWAVCFDRLGISWTYEPQGLDIGGVRYLPDFELPDMGEMLVEVKGRMNVADMRKILVTARHAPVLVLGDVPRPDVAGPHFRLFVQRLYPSARVVRNMSFGPYWGGWCLESGGEERGPEAFDDAVGWAVNLFEAATVVERTFPTYDAIATAFTAARSARFEHGESGGAA